VKIRVPQKTPKIRANSCNSWQKNPSSATRLYGYRLGEDEEITGLVT
jgi:hypothetical protein